MQDILSHEYLPIEVVDLIFDNVMCPSLFKQILQTSKYMNKTHKHKKAYFCNLLWTLIKKYPDQGWNWYWICINPNTTIKIFEEQNKLGVLGFKNFSYNSNLAIDFVKMHLDKEWDWSLVSANPNITMHDIENNPELPWEFKMVQSNPNITLKYVEDKIPVRFLDTGYLSSNRRLSMQDIEDNHIYPGLIHNYSSVAINPNLTIDFVKKHIDRFERDNFSDISRNPNITLQNILDNPELPWIFYDICSNPNITMKMLEDHVINEFILNGLIKQNDTWSGLSYNPNLTKEFVDAHPEIHWDWEAVFQNISATEEMIDKMHQNDSNFVDFAGLSMNKYGK